MNDKILKFVIVAAVLLLALPFIIPLLPKAATFERAKIAFEEAGFTVTKYKEAAVPRNQAISLVSMQLDDVGLSGARVEIFEYDDEGKIVKNLSFSKAGSGTTLPGLANLAASLGAATNPMLSESARNGMMMVVAMGENRDELQLIIKIFKRL